MKGLVLQASSVIDSTGMTICKSLVQTLLHSPLLSLAATLGWDRQSRPSAYPVAAGLARIGYTIARPITICVHVAWELLGPSIERGPTGGPGQALVAFSGPIGSVQRAPHVPLDHPVALSARAWERRCGLAGALSCATRVAGSLALRRVHVDAQQKSGGSSRAAQKLPTVKVIHMLTWRVKDFPTTARGGPGESSLLRHAVHRQWLPLRPQKTRFEKVFCFSEFAEVWRCCCCWQGCAGPCSDRLRSLSAAIAAVKGQRRPGREQVWSSADQHSAFLDHRDLNCSASRSREAEQRSTSDNANGVPYPRQNCRRHRRMRGEWPETSERISR